jgi:hypothetical protein
VRDAVGVWIEDNLKLKLSETKTLITKLKSNKQGKCHFLGFELSYYSSNRILNIGNTRKINPINRRKFTIIKTSSTRISFQQRTTNPTLITAIDKKRILPRLEQSKFIKK